MNSQMLLNSMFNDFSFDLHVINEDNYISGRDISFKINNNKTVFDINVYYSNDNIHPVYMVLPSDTVVNIGEYNENNNTFIRNKNFFEYLFEYLLYYST